MASDSEMVRIWITDGSPVPFVDVRKLSATQPSIMGRSLAYKGWVDLAVPVGSASVVGERVDDQFAPEAEWCLSFPDDMAQYIERPDNVTPTLQW